MWPHDFYARQPSLLLLFGKGERLRENCSLTRSVFCCVCCVLCCDGWCVLQPEPIVLWEAAAYGQLDEVKAAVDAGARMEWAHPYVRGYRAVHIASITGHKDVVAFLGSRGADVNAGDNTQTTPLHLAAMRGHASVCTTLLALGADSAAKSKAG